MNLEAWWPVLASAVAVLILVALSRAGDRRVLPRRERSGPTGDGTGSAPEIHGERPGTGGAGAPATPAELGDSLRAGQINGIPYEFREGPGTARVTLTVELEQGGGDVPEPLLVDAKHGVEVGRLGARKTAELWHLSRMGAQRVDIGAGGPWLRAEFGTGASPMRDEGRAAKAVGHLLRLWKYCGGPGA